MNNVSQLNSRKNYKQLLKISVCVSALISFPLLISGQALAQTKPATTVDKQKVEEVVVTAQLRSESLQSVPLAVTAIAGAALQRSSVTSLADIQYLVSGVTFRPGSAPDYKVRGVGTQTFDYGIESSVGLVIDGVAQAIPRSPALTTLADISGVEVLKGPQGTLFGRNASSGMISVSTTRPVPGALEAMAHLSYGTRNETIGYATVNVPFSDIITGRLTIGSKHRDGFINNLYTNTKLYETDDSNINAKLLFKPSDKLSALITIDSQRNSDNGSTQWTTLKLAPGPSILRDRLAAYGIVPGPKNLNIVNDGPNYRKIYLRGVSATINYEIGDQTLTSISAFRKMNLLSQLELDSSDLPRYNTNLATQESSQESQEFRLTSPTGKRLEYIVGLYYIKVRNDVSQDQWGTLDLKPVDSPIWAGGKWVSGNRGSLMYATTNRSLAAYSNLVVNVSDKLKIFGGYRWTKDHVYSLEYVRQVANICTTAYVSTGVCQPTVFPSPQNLRVVDHSDWLGKIGVKYQFSDDIMGYFSGARGYKGPTVNNVSGAATLVRPETNISYELGLKTALVNDRVTFNIDLFKTHFTDFQTQTYDTTIFPFGFILGNAGGMESRGVELEFTAKPSENLKISGNAVYADTYFTDYKLFCNVGTCVGMNNILGVFTPRLMDAKGLSPVNAPKVTYNLSADYLRPFSENLDLDAHMNWSWRSEAMGYVADPNTKFDAYGLLSANVGIASKDGKWRVGIFGRNLLDQFYPGGFIPTIFNTGGYSTVPDGNGGFMRTVGIVLDVKM